NLVALLTLLKGLPMTYNRDLQEDKEQLFDTTDTVRATVRIMTAMLNHTSPNRSACAAASSDPLLLATDLADYLVRKGFPFRKAHHIVGQVVATAERQGKKLDEMAISELREIEKSFGPDATEIFDLRKSMERRKITGAPGTAEVKKQLARWRRLLGSGEAR